MKNAIFPLMAFSALFVACNGVDEGSSLLHVSEGAALNCEASMSEDSSSLFVICDGDTIGTLHNGIDGKDGVNGKNGKNGENGLNGKNGKDGVDGKDGARGDDGVDGKDGAKGDDGEDGKSCSVKDTTDSESGRKGALIYCEDGSKAVVWSGLDGACPKCNMDVSSSSISSSSKASVSSSSGTSAGADDSFFVDPRDGSKYKTVSIDGMIWFAENLKFNLGENCNVSGFKGCIYTYQQALENCPAGWHVASQEEYWQVATYLGASCKNPSSVSKVYFDISYHCNGVAAALKDPSSWPNSQTTNTTGFSAKPLSQSTWSGNFGTWYAGYWTSEETISSPTGIQSFWVSIDDGEDYLNLLALDPIDRQLSVRCVKGLPTYDVELNTSSSTETPEEVVVVQGRFTDTRDNHVYKTVTLNDQTWMAENLNYVDANIVDGSNSFCYDNNPDNCSLYGRYYTWAAAMDYSNQGSCGYGVSCKHQGVCPPGWHIPTKDDFTNLLRLTKGDIQYDEDDDKYGFSAKPLGYVSSTGVLNEFQENGYFWSSAETLEEAWFLGVLPSVASMGNGPRTNAYTIRCVKDQLCTQSLLSKKGITKDLPNGRSFVFRIIDLPADFATGFCAKFNV